MRAWARTRSWLQDLPGGPHPALPVPRRSGPVTGVIEWLMVLTAGFFILHWSYESYGTDLQVYRHGGQALLSGADLYAPFVGPPGDPGLPFTYPPFAAAVFTPLAGLPFRATFIGLSLVSVALVHLMMSDVTARFADLPVVRHIPAWVLTILSLFSMPVDSTLGFGQINIVLMALCYLAVTRLRSWRWFAVAVGLTAGIKLTPILLLGAPIVRGRWRAVAWGLGTFLATQLVTLLTVPGLTVRYWGHVIHDPSRIGDVWYIDNLSLRGVLERQGAPELVWLALALAVVALFVFALFRAGHLLDDAALVAALSGLALLVSPITWAHHFVWFIVIVPAWIQVARAKGVGTAARVTLLAASALLLALMTFSVRDLFDVQSVRDPARYPFTAVLLAAVPAAALVLGTLGLAVVGRRAGEAKGAGGDAHLDMATAGSRPS